MAIVESGLTSTHRVGVVTPSAIGAGYRLGAAVVSKMAGKHSLIFELYQLPSKTVRDIKYRCTMSKSGSPDTAFSAQSIQLRLKRQSEDSILNSGSVSFPAASPGLESYLVSGATCTVDMITTYADGEQDIYTICTLDFSAASLNMGPRNRTITFQGSGYYPPQSLQVYVPSNVSTFGGNFNDSFRMRCSPQFGLSAGMGIKYDDEFYVATELIYNIGVNSAYMDINMVR